MIREARNLEDVRELIRVLTRRIGLLNKNCCGIEGISVSAVQSHILHEINRRDEPVMQQVAETLGVDITTFSRQIQSMVSAGLVQKNPHPEDRRFHILTLTEKGKVTAAYIDSAMGSFFDEIFSHMTEFEKETVVRSLKLLNASMAKSKKCCGLNN